MTGGLLGDRLPHVAYGGDYNPEQWPEEIWEEDIRLMHEAGVNLVSVGVFSWSRLQPRANSFDFSWLDRLMNLLHGAGIAVDLATATATPPPWLSHCNPEMLPILADGARLWPGGRQHYCPSSPAYRTAARRLVTALAERYGSHPALAMWHVGNEYGCHVPACWCDESARDFRAWLICRYRTLDELNRAWGTDFWSQRYSDWEEILPPRRAPTWPNPSQQLDFHRFSSDALLECFELERAVLAQHSPGMPITTNFMGFFKPLDYWKWAEREDVVSNDSYPDPADPDAHARAAMAGDLMRSLGRGRPWVLMEQTTNRVNWRPVNVAKAPGQMRLWSYQAVARGADGVMFFQWRQSRAGAEKFHSAMVPHGPAGSSPTWQEVVRLGGELRRLNAVCRSRVQAEVAILLDWESWWALELPSKPSARLSLMGQLESYYRPLFEANVTADFARPSDDLSPYRLVLAPNLYLVSDGAARNLAGYVASGGTLVMSFFSGIVDEADHIRLGGYPAPFRELLGLHVEDFLPLGEGSGAEVRFADGSVDRGEIWSELVRLHGAEALATFVSGPLDGQPAVTRHAYGRGSAYYLATRLAPPAMSQLLRRIWSECGVRPVAEAPVGVEAVRRAMPDGSLLFLLNHGQRTVEVSAKAGSVELLSGAPLPSDRILLARREIAIIVRSGGQLPLQRRAEARRLPDPSEPGGKPLGFRLHSPERVGANVLEEAKDDLTIFALGPGVTAPRRARARSPRRPRTACAPRQPAKPTRGLWRAARPDRERPLPRRTSRRGREMVPDAEAAPPLLEADAPHRSARDRLPPIRTVRIALMPAGPAAGTDPRTRLVDICLALPEAQASGDQHVRFHVRNKTFAYYLDDHHGDGRVALCCKVPTGDLDPLVALDPERYFVPRYLGSRGWIGVRLDLHDIDWDEIAKFARVSYRLIAPKRLADLAR